MRSMSSNERLDELIRELHRVDWDVILISETWRQNKEVWEIRQQTRGCDTVEQKMEESDQMGAL